MTIASNGVRMYHFRCARCRRSHGSSGIATSISHAAAQAWADSNCLSLDDVPVWSDHRDEKKVCAVRGCDSFDVERHHWAPRHLFDDTAFVPDGEWAEGGYYWYESELWPVSYLCRKHHQEWHRRVTPNMSAKRSA